MISEKEALNEFKKNCPQYSIKHLYDSKGYYLFEINEKRTGGCFAVKKEGGFVELSPMISTEKKIIDSAQKLW